MRKDAAGSGVGVGTSASCAGAAIMKLGQFNNGVIRSQSVISSAEMSPVVFSLNREDGSEVEGALDFFFALGKKINGVKLLKRIRKALFLIDMINFERILSWKRV